MEAVLRRAARTSFRSEGRHVVVPPRPDCRCGGHKVLPSQFPPSFMCARDSVLTSRKQIRLYSRDLELSNQNVLHREILAAPVIILSLVDNSLLVYTADNTLSHFLIFATSETIKLHLCGSITFDGMIAVPSAVRLLSWMIPTAQKREFSPVNSHCYS
jgi:hypothetical protein